MPHISRVMAATGCSRTACVPRWIPQVRADASAWWVQDVSLRDMASVSFCAHSGILSSSVVALPYTVEAGGGSHSVSHGHRSRAGTRTPQRIVSAVAPTRAASVRVEIGETK